LRQFVGFFLDPILIFTGAASSKLGIEKMVEEAGFKNALVLMKRGKPLWMTNYLVVF
jgi:hypothetical protein